MIKNTLILSFGTISAQFIPFIALPFLTRIYDQTDFGQFALYFSIVAILNVFTTFRLDQTLVLAKEKSEMTQRLRTLTAQLLSITTILLIAVYSIDSVQEFIVLDSFYLKVLPIGAFASAMILCFTYALLWLDKYKLLAIFKITNALLYVSLALVLPYVTTTVNGIIVGWLVGQLIICLAIAIYLLANKISLSPRFNANIYREYKDVLYFNFPSSLISKIAQEIPSIAISKIYSLSALGIYGMIIRVLGAPISLIGTAVSQVLLKDIASRINGNSSIKTTVKTSAILLSCIASIMLIALYILPQSFYKLVLGTQWESLGIYLNILAPAFALKLVVVPLSSLLLPLRKLHWLAVWQVTSFVALAYLFFFIEENFIEKLHSYVIVDFSLYFIYLLIILESVRRYECSLANNNNTPRVVE